MIFGFERLSLPKDGADWPNRALSRTVRAGGLEWHVQEAGAGPTILLIHGTGAATHSWRDMLPALAARFRVVAADLPGHGFTDAPPAYRLSLPGMAAAHAELLAALDAKPDIVVGHSAGAAIGLRMTIDGRIAPKVVLAINGALRPFKGAAGQVFPWMARLLFLNPFTPRVFAWSAVDRTRVRRLLNGTGSTISDDQIGLYARLFSNPGHVSGALGMMAHWSLEPLVADLAKLETRFVLLVGAKDGTVPPSDAEATLAACPKAERIVWPDAGHLTHEERPGETVALIARLADEAGLEAETS